MKRTILLYCLLFSFGEMCAQTTTVTGHVTSGGLPLPGVNIVVKGTNQGTTTDAEGNYTINVSPSATLVFTFIGYSTAEMPVNNQTVINVAMTEDLQTLSEVVVVGYGEQSKRTLSTSVSSIEGDAIARQPVSNFEQTMQGQIPGVQVTSPTGAPGSAINVRIRGNNSYSLGNEPLYVIDGIPLVPRYDEDIAVGNQRSNPLASINPNDIESIDVLKDGAAAAIYGSRAANGVVVITTKRGKAGKAQLGFNAYFGVQQLRKKIDLLNGNEFAQLYNEIRDTQGLPPAYDPDTVRTNTDWQDLLYRNAPMRNYQVTASGGSDQTRYYISGGYFDQEGTVINSGFKRYSFKVNLDQNLRENLRVGTSLNISRQDRNGSVRSELRLENSGTILGALAQIPTMPVYESNGQYALNPFTLMDNPVGGQNETHHRTLSNQIFGNFYGEWDVVKNLTFRSAFGIDFKNNLENQYNTRELPGTLNAASEDRGSGATATSEELIWLWENTLTYNWLVDQHDFTFLLGSSFQESNRFTSSASASGFPTNSVPYLSTATQNQAVSSYEDAWGLTSYYGRVIYNFANKYLATASIRADGSSRFSKDNRFGFFPAISLGWRISEEGFFSSRSFLSDLKLRVSAAANGNQGIGQYARFSTYGTGQNYNGIGGVGPNTIGNEDLRWETTYQYNVGVDAGAFSDRLTLSFDAYYKRTKDVLTNVPLPLSAGYAGGESFIVQNIGAVENKGIELGINSINLDNAEGLSWNTQFNFALNRNKVLDMGTEVNSAGETVEKVILGDYWISRKGAPIGSFYGYVADGIFQNQAEVESAPVQNSAAPGDIRFANIDDSDNIITPEDRTIIGNPNPDFVAGLTNTLTFKGIELSIFFQGSFGNDIFNENLVTIEGMANAFNQTRRVLSRWTTEGQQTDVPRAVYADPNGNTRVSTRFIEDGSYVRLKNLTLAYNFPSAMLEKISMSSARIYVTGENLLTFTDYTGYDPEVSADPTATNGFGRDLGVYPQSKIFTVGVNIQF